ncbi:hypothetical protein RBB50_007049 [Rhinocladiella similis]
MATTTTTKNASNSVANDGLPEAKIMQLPTEVLTEIIYYTLASVELCCSGAMKWTNELRKPLPLLDLQLTCKRFHTMSLQVLSNRKYLTVNLIGPVPVTDIKRMNQVHKYYTSLLMTNFQPAIEKQGGQEVLINLLPELNSQIPPAGINWAPCDPQRPPCIDKDDVTVRKVMVSHQAAAILLSAIMRSIVLRHPNLRLRVVFHDVDWMCPGYRDEKAQDLRRVPLFNPFWDLTGVCGIIYHWRWLRENCGEQRDKFSDVFTTPTIALAINVHLRWAWDNYTPPKADVITALDAGGTVLAKDVFEFSLARLTETWMDSPGAQWSRESVARPVRHYIPGYPEKVVCSENKVFAQWLTTICQDSHYTTCFAVRGAGSSQVAQVSDIAMELEAPGGRTLMMHSYCR